MFVFTKCHPYWESSLLVFCLSAFILFLVKYRNDGMFIFFCLIFTETPSSKKLFFSLKFELSLPPILLLKRERIGTIYSGL